MITIPFEICGTVWNNPTEVKECLEKTNILESIELDFKFEGPSLQEFGIVKMLDEHCQRTGRNKNTIAVVRNSNQQELTGYYNTGIGISHFFKMSQKYWSDPKILSDNPKTFGYFIGRKTRSRTAMMFDIWKKYQNNFLLSALKSEPWLPLGEDVVCLERIDDWVAIDCLEDFSNWYNNLPIPSLDNHSVRDQYDGINNTNKSILNYYDCFQIELVAETYTVGNTFFPTEKTVRPITAAKPILVYGPKNFLGNLRVLGFKTYQTCWDESYDLLEGPARWVAMQQVIDQLINDNSWVEEANKIARHNRNHLQSIIKL